MKRPLLIPVLASLVFFSCNKEEEQKEGQESGAATSTNVVSVVAAPLQSTTFEDWASYPAELRGSTDAVLSAGPGGRVQSVAAVGTWAQAGQALCDIESARYLAMVEQAEAAVTLTQGEFERTEVNVKAGSIGKAALDKAKLDLQGAKVNLLQAKRAYDDSRCIAPFNGVVVSRSIEPYSTVAPGYPTVRLARTDRLEALISLPESEMNAYAKGSKVRFLIPGTKLGEFTGTLSSVDLAVDARSRTAQARLDIVNRDRKLGPGMAGKALLLRKVYSNAIVIPTTAVLRNEQGAFAMVAENKVAHKHDLVLGPSRSDSVVVLQGLKAGDVLITVGSFRASEGTIVQY